MCGSSPACSGTTNTCDAADAGGTCKCGTAVACTAGETAECLITADGMVDTAGTMTTGMSCQVNENIGYFTLKNNIMKIIGV